MLTYTLCRQALAYNQAEQHSHPAAQATLTQRRRLLVFIADLFHFMLYVLQCGTGDYGKHGERNAGGRGQACVRQWSFAPLFFCARARGGYESK